MQAEGSDLSRDKEWTDAPAFDDLYDKYKDMIFSFACYLTQHRGEAEDLFQETWLRIVKKLPEKVNMQSLKAWIFTVIANLHKDMLRKKRIRRVFFQRPIYQDKKDVNFDMPGTPPDSLKETDYVDMSRDINRALAALPDRLRRVFVLKEIAGFQQAEIGDILGIPLGTVKSLMHRAVKRLRQELSAYNPKNERIKCDVKTLSV